MSGGRAVERDTVGQEGPYTAPPGAPAWITSDLIQDTIETWQPYYAQDLTTEDAVGILRNASWMMGGVLAADVGIGQETGEGRDG